MNAGSLVVVLLLVAILGVVAWMALRPAAPSSVTYVTNEADKRKKLGASYMGTGINFAW